MLDSVLSYQSGIWFHRAETPCLALKKRGHAVKQVAIGTEIPEDLMQWPDVVVFGRTYAQHFDPIKIMRDYKKLGKKVVYDIDDDIWNVSKDNPSHLVATAFKDQYEGMMREADTIITPSPVLAKKIKKFVKKKPVMLCPNGIDFDSGNMYTYQERPHENRDTLKIGYMGAASHWKDLQLIGKTLSKLSKKYDFLFVIYGITGEPLEAAIYNYNKMLQLKLQPEKAAYHKAAIDFYEQLQEMRMWHIPFMPPELHPRTLSMCDFDIGIAPLEDNSFNHGKSNIKYYEYAAVGTVCLASDVKPYSEEVPLRAKNTEKDWYKKLEKLIVDKDYRAKQLMKQQKWVRENRSTKAIGLKWELALQKKGGLKVLNQK